MMRLLRRARSRLAFCARTCVRLSACFGALVPLAVGGYALARALCAPPPAAIASGGSGGVDTGGVDAGAPAWLHDADRARKSGALDEAAALAEAHLAGPLADRAYALGVQARVAMARASYELAARLLGEAIALHEARGDVRGEAEDRFALAYLEAVYRFRLDEASRVLGPRAEALAREATVAAKLAYYRAIVAMGAGNPRRALALLEDAARRAEAVGDASLRDDAEENHALVLTQIGRGREARVAFGRLLSREPASSPPCARVARRTNAALGAMAEHAASTSADVRRSAATEAIRLLEEALAITEANCANAFLEANAAIELSRAKLAAGDARGAKGALAASRFDDRAETLPLRAARLELEASIALAEGRVGEAMRGFTELTSSFETADPTLRWSAWLGLARARRASGDTRGASSAYEAAERALDEAALSVPLGEGRGATGVAFRASAREWIALLVASGRAGDALRVARAAESRTLRTARVLGTLASLAEGPREAWERSVSDYAKERAAIDEEALGDWECSRAEVIRRRALREARLRSARAALEEALARAVVRSRAHEAISDLALDGGDLAVLVVPADERGERGFVFAATPGRVRVHGVAMPDRARRMPAEALLEPIRDLLASADRIRVLSSDAIADVDVHAIPIAGVPLGLSKSVVYTVEEGVDSAEPRRGALVVSDPAGNLPGARTEVAEVVASLVALGEPFAPLVQLTQAEATASRVREQVARVALFHHAGHASFSGREGWESALRLASDTELSIADVLALPGAPELVVLSACSATHMAEGGGGFGLAHAFLARGARAVTGPTRPIPDAMAAAFSRSFYRALKAQTAVVRPRDVQVAFDAAIRALHNDATASAEDWASFRLWSRQ
jgi:tetratricopeptide (TPR) repeat protein